MESKGNTNAHVLMFGLSFNLILTLGSLGFTCYSLHRLDSRVTAVEQNPAYQFTDGVIVEPTFRHQRSGGSEVKENFPIKISADRPMLCRKCSSVCLNSNGHMARNFGHENRACAYFTANMAAKHSKSLYDINKTK